MFRNAEFETLRAQLARKADKRKSRKANKEKQ